MFQQKGTFVVASEGVGEDALMEVALEAGADDVTTEGDVFQITCSPAAFGKVKGTLADRKIPTISAQIAMIPANTIPVGAEKAQQVLSLMEALEEHEDVQNVFANFDIPDDIMTKLTR